MGKNWVRESEGVSEREREQTNERERKWERESNIMRLKKRPRTINRKVYVYNYNRVESKRHVER